MERFSKLVCTLLRCFVPSNDSLSRSANSIGPNMNGRPIFALIALPNSAGWNKSYSGTSVAVFLLSREFTFVRSASSRGSGADDLLLPFLVPCFLSAEAACLYFSSSSASAFFSANSYDFSLISSSSSLWYLIRPARAEPTSASFSEVVT